MNDAECEKCGFIFDLNFRRVANIITNFAIISKPKENIMWDQND